MPDPIIPIRGNYLNNPLLFSKQSEIGFSFENLNYQLNIILQPEPVLNSNKFRWLIGIFIDFSPLSQEEITELEANEGIVVIDDGEQNRPPSAIKVKYLYIETTETEINSGVPDLTNAVLPDPDVEAEAFEGATFTPIPRRTDKYSPAAIQISGPDNIPVIEPLHQIRYEVTNYQSVSSIRYINSRKWARRAFFDRSDLELMKFYLDSGDYQDIFFSGATINYGHMSNHHLELQRRKQKQLKNIEASNCFTLKAEPITTRLRYRDDELSTVETVSDGNPENVMTPMPAVFLAAPCPFYWEMYKKVNTGISGLVDVDGKQMLYSRDFQNDLRDLVMSASHMTSDDIYDPQG